ncbi:hypothetical protein [Olleya sp. Bg11-27]|uniref:hypothetical protein n=1 Tax=Olleya sp. Bg11-27 TaxID=2058135 RepID=UPI0012FD4FD4|nr:hypothetical protein [Olleya sp. Bg11-27]
MLLVIVLAVWGAIGYKIINGLSPNNPEITKPDFNVSFNPKIDFEIDTFSIQVIYKDPFLGTLASKNKKANAKSFSNFEKPENTPIVTYSGLVKKQNASNPVFVININNRQYLLKQGQTADSITLIKGNTKAITIQYKNKSQIINRK